MSSSSYREDGLNQYEMKKTITGWVVINIGHPRTEGKFINGWSFSSIRKECIAKFVANTGYKWEYWRKKYNFRCVRATQMVYVSDSEFEK